MEDKLGSLVPEEQKRFFAIKLLEKDDKIQNQMKSIPDVSAEINQMEKTKTSIDSFPVYKELHPKYAMWALACLLACVLMFVFIRRLP